MEVFGGKVGGRNGAMLIPTNSFLLFFGSYGCVNFGENRSRNATVRVLADGHTHTHTHTHGHKSVLESVPCYYTIVVGQIIIRDRNQQMLS